MREGIYLDHTPKSDSDHLTGFVVHFCKGLQVSPFTHCTMPFIQAHAKARNVDGPIYIVTPNPKP